MRLTMTTPWSPTGENEARSKALRKSKTVCDALYGAHVYFTLTL